MIALSSVLPGEVLGEAAMVCTWVQEPVWSAPVGAGRWACEGESQAVFWPTAHEQGLGTQPTSDDPALGL